MAALLGAVVGLEREVHEHEAGTRTHLLLALGAALFTIAGAYGFHDFAQHGAGGDPTRVAAQIVTGIGFLGGGAILRQGLTVRGLTTAASLWMVAAVGLATGAGYYWAAVAGTGLTLLALWPLNVLEHRLVGRAGKGGRLAIELDPGQNVAPLLEELGGLQSLAIGDEPGKRVVTVVLAGTLDYGLVTRVADLPYVNAVRQVD